MTELHIRQNVITGGFLYKTTGKFIWTVYIDSSVSRASGPYRGTRAAISWYSWGPLWEFVRGYCR